MALTSNITSPSRIGTAIAVAILITLEAGYCRAEIVLGEYIFAGNLDASSVSPGFIFTNLSTIQRGLTVLAPTAQESLETRGWPDNQDDPGGAKLSLDDYFGFEITNNTGNYVLLSSLSLQVRRPGLQSAFRYQIRGSSSGDFTLAGADILSHDDETSAFGIAIMNSFGTPHVFDFQDFSLSNGSSIQFRFYAFSADNGSPIAPVYFDNIKLFAVPEPSGLLMLSIASITVFVRRRRVPNHRVNRSTRLGVFEVENLSRVPGYAYRSSVN